jgi:hypothetical protein
MGAVIRLAAMPGTNRLLPLLAVLFVLAVLSGCGSDEISGEIPQTNADELTAALDAVRTATESSPPNCVDAASGAEQFVDAANALPADPVAELKAELQAAGDNLRTLVDNKCAATGPTGTTQSTPTIPTDTTDTTPTDTTPPHTTTTDTTTTDTTTDTTTTDQTQPPGNGDGGGTDGGTGGTGGGSSGDEGDE